MLSDFNKKPRRCGVIFFVNKIIPYLREVKIDLKVAGS